MSCVTALEAGCESDLTDCGAREPDVVLCHCARARVCVCSVCVVCIRERNGSKTGAIGECR